VDVINAHGPPIDDKFVIKGDDMFRVVEIGFSVNGFIDRSRCDLYMRESSSNAKEYIQSVRRDNGDVIGGEYVHQKAVLSISIAYDGCWEVNDMYLNKLVSMDFVKSFLVQGMRAHQEFNPNINTRLRTMDRTNERELYWLERRTGRTYLQGEWDLEYDWLLDFNIDDYHIFHHKILHSFDMPAMNAIYDSSFDPPLHFHGTFLPFGDTFQEELRAYNATKTQEELDNMTVGMIIDEFVPRWSQNSRYDTMSKQLLAQNTVVYFFRHYEHAEDVFDLVLNEYSPSPYVNLMTGSPRDYVNINFLFYYERDLPSLEAPSLIWSAREGQNIDSDSSDSDNERSERIGSMSPYGHNVSFEHWVHVLCSLYLTLLIFSCSFYREEYTPEDYYEEL